MLNQLSFTGNTDVLIKVMTTHIVERYNVKEIGQTHLKY